jgi:excisionase family DNA binding protein
VSPAKTFDQSLDLYRCDERHWSYGTQPTTPNHIKPEGSTMIVPETTRPVKRGRSTAADELLSIAEVCDELGVSRATFYRWRAHRKGPESLRLPNGTVRIRRSALEQFLTACAKRDAH